jgi:hypothetical protein
MDGKEVMSSNHVRTLMPVLESRKLLSAVENKKLSHYRLK